jgi:transcriptional regulator with XRE-family HTH domain
VEQLNLIVEVCGVQPTSVEFTLVSNNSQYLAPAEWADQVAQRVGAGIRKRRTEMGLSAAKLAERTAAIGYPISRSTIAKMEANARGGKIEVPELLALANVLEMPPVALLWWDAPDARAHILPRLDMTSGDGFSWTAGEGVLSYGGSDETGDADTQVVRVRSLRRLLAARHVLFLLKMQRFRASNGADEMPPDEDVSSAYREVDNAETEAIAHGWEVRRG